jgi:hypothetical protein
MREISKNHQRVLAGTMLASAVGLWGLVGQSAPAQAGIVPTTTHADLHALNNSGVVGESTVTVNGQDITVDVTAQHLLKRMPHAMHLHFDKHARHTCPTVSADRNHDHRVSTSEGHRAYGMIKTSLTTRGDTSPKSGLAVKRFPQARDGKIDYHRTIHVSQKLADAITNGKVSVVIHGIDYNQNHKYDFKAGKSDLDPKLPAEATDPVSCGVLKQQPVL